MEVSLQAQLMLPVIRRGFRWLGTTRPPFQNLEEYNMTFALVLAFAVSSQTRGPIDGLVPTEMTTILKGMSKYRSSMADIFMPPAVAPVGASQIPAQVADQCESLLTATVAPDVRPTAARTHFFGLKNQFDGCDVVGITYALPNADRVAWLDLCAAFGVLYQPASLDRLGDEASVKAYVISTGERLLNIPAADKGAATVAIRSKPMLVGKFFYGLAQWNPPQADANGIYHGETHWDNDVDFWTDGRLIYFQFPGNGLVTDVVGGRRRLGG